MTAHVNEPLSRERRIGNWIINCCIVIALVSTWSVERWPQFTVLFVGSIIFVSIVGLVALGVIIFREQLAEVAKAKASLSKPYHIRPRATGAISAEYLTAFKTLPNQRIHSERWLKVFSDQLYTPPEATFLAIYENWLMSTKVVRQPSHYKLDPPGKSYSVIIGAVRIDVSGDETKVTVENNKKVTISTPTTAQVELPKDPKSDDIATVH